ncbi:GntR family transcriptional regulator [Cupriavidus basilensis]|uniref:GntR family transcriptional regulator n=1 Tax=Cupriavidus basilensis TaxID=68895 RepID=A0ABT6AY86_9BURK|nr:GntR family transcriptional regulator [Cupriavidus basilensis]MDF3836651.1 GntR family transcriptional regulator [Cupriavidus basilensis]
MSGADARVVSRAEAVYAQLRDDIFEFRLLPGDRFTEGEIALRLGVSRTPVREALLRLQSDALVQVYFRSGWEVVPLDFTRFDELYALRKLIETHAVRMLCTPTAPSVDRGAPAQLAQFWCVPESERLEDGRVVAQHDEAFHAALVAAAGNREIAAVHRQVSERIRIIRRLDFTYAARVAATYDEHAAILREIQRQHVDQAMLLLSSHIEASRAEARKITLHHLQTIRTGAGNARG